MLPIPPLIFPPSPPQHCPLFPPLFTTLFCYLHFLCDPFNQHFFPCPLFLLLYYLSSNNSLHGVFSFSRIFWYLPCNTLPRDCMSSAAWMTFFPSALPISSHGSLIWKHNDVTQTQTFNVASPGPVYEHTVLDDIDQPVTMHLVNLSGASVSSIHSDCIIVTDSRPYSKIIIVASKLSLFSISEGESFACPV